MKPNKLDGTALDVAVELLAAIARTSCVSDTTHGARITDGGPVLCAACAARITLAAIDEMRSCDECQTHNGCVCNKD